MLGYLWALMRPLMLFGVLYVVFSQIVKFGSGIPNYPVLLLFNIVLFELLPGGDGSAVTAVAAPAQENARAQDALPAHGDPAVGRPHRRD